MKALSIILSFLLNTCLIANTPATLSEEQAKKLFESAWKEPPQSIDITYNLTYRDNSKTEKELRQMYKEIYNDMHETAEEVSPSMREGREKFIRSNVEHFLEERKYRRRFRFEESRLRMDETRAGQESAKNSRLSRGKNPLEEGFAVSEHFEKSYIEVTDQNKVTERYLYNHTEKQVNRLQFSYGWDKEILQFGLSPVAQLLRAKVGESQGGSHVNFSPDPNKFEQLRTNTVDGLSVNVEPDQNEPDVKDRINLVVYWDEEKEPFMEVTMVCDKQDYAKVYVYKERYVKNSDPHSTRICSDFDDQGYPHNIIATEFDTKGKLKRKKIYQIENVDLNIQIPDAVFRFDPPEDYMVYDYDMTPEEQETALIAYSKKMLTSEEGVERMKALDRLARSLRKSNPEELRDIAIAMKDDKEPTIRSMAEVILRMLERDKSDTE